MTVSTLSRGNTYSCNYCKGEGEFPNRLENFVVLCTFCGGSGRLPDRRKRTLALAWGEHERRLDRRI